MDGLQFYFSQEFAVAYSIMKHTQKTSSVSAYELPCEMSKSSDTQILEGSPATHSYLRGYILQFPALTLKFTSGKQF